MYRCGLALGTVSNCFAIIHRIRSIGRSVANSIVARRFTGTADGLRHAYTRWPIYSLYIPRSLHARQTSIYYERCYTYGILGPEIRP